MPESCNAEDKFEGFDVWKIRDKAEALTSVQELKDKPEMLKAVQKYLREEELKKKQAVDLAENL